MIHETACIDPKAQLGKGVSVGPFSVIGPHVKIGDGTEVGAHVVITGDTEIGPDNQFFPFSCIGEAPQDLKYKGEATRLQIGEHNIFREGATVHRGSIQDQGVTIIGDHNLFMANTHIAHDCVVANHVILVNGAALSGHVIVEDYVICSGGVGVHQFCRLGKHSFLIRGAMVGKDVIPYTVVSGEKANVEGLNRVGLKRRGFTDEQIVMITKAYKIIYREGLVTTDAIKKLTPLAAEHSVVEPMLNVLARSERGIVR